MGSFETLESRALLSATVASIGAATDHSGVNDVSIAVPAAGVAVNDTVIVQIAADPTFNVVTVTDDAGNVYSQDGNVENVSGGPNVETWIFSAPVTAALAAGDHIIAHFGASGPNAMAVSALSVNGLVGSNKLDVTQTGTGSSTAANSGLTAATTFAEELLIGAIGVEGPSADSFTAGSGYTLVGRAGSNTGGAASNVTINPVYQSVSATGQYSATGTLTLSRDWAAAIATYRIDTAPNTPADADTATADSVAEGAPTGTYVGLTAHSTATDGEASTHTYSLTADSSGGGFQIDLNSGVVTVADGSLINFEAGGSYSITVQASDGAFTASQPFNIAVTNVAPSTPTDNDSLTDNIVAEGAATGTTVGLTALAIDPAGGDVTYSITADSSGGGFQIDSATGVVTVDDGSLLDFFISASHTITVQASDGSLTSEQTFTISVENVAPSLPEDSDLGTPDEVAEGAATGAYTGLTVFPAIPWAGP